METGPRLKVLSDRLVKPLIKPGTPGLQGKQFIHYTTAAPREYGVFIIPIKTYLKIIFLIFQPKHNLCCVSQKCPGGESNK